MRNERGQSLVEMALIMPVLLIMFLGVVEVGWAIRSYMTLLNASREVARFVSRGMYDDNQAYVHFNNTLAGVIQTNISNTTVYIYRFDTEPGSPFTETDDAYTYTLSVVGILHQPHADEATIASDALRLGASVNVEQYERELFMACEGPDPNPDRCDALAAFDFDTAPIGWRSEEFVYVEIHYDHSQLLGFFGQYKIPIYVHTVMRINRLRGP